MTLEEVKGGYSRNVEIARSGFGTSRLPISLKTAVSIQPKLRVNSPGDEYELEADRVADQLINAPEIVLQSHIQPQSARKEGPAIQLKHSSNQSSQQVHSKESSEAAPIIHQVLNSPGQPLDSRTRAFFEPRLGHDLSSVRVHTDQMATKSADNVSALAYTIGNNIIFAAGHYAPGTQGGRRLLAHELAHVVQQSKGLPSGLLQRQPAQASEQKPRPADVDKTAQAIIDIAQDPKRPISERAEAVVNAIIKEYFSSLAKLVIGVKYKKDIEGLETESSLKEKVWLGTIFVGDYFVNNTNQRQFARRVVQVRHEIEHIEQYRAGMRGDKRQDEREFFAHYHGAISEEMPGTGKIQHSTRVALIDGALGYYYCLPEKLRKDNFSKRDELVALRKKAIKKSGRNDLGEAPTTCTK